MFYLPDKSINLISLLFLNISQISFIPFSLIWFPYL
jgi:hypothetical protein